MAATPANTQIVKALSRFFDSTGRVILVLTCISMAVLSCQNNDSNKYDAAEANLKIMGIFALRDSECSTNHTLDGFILTKADRTTVDLCVSEVYMLSCDEWQNPDPAPASCRAIGVSFK